MKRSLRGFDSDYKRLRDVLFSIERKIADAVGAKSLTSKGWKQLDKAVCVMKVGAKIMKNQIGVK